jgi:hypothetical protein
MRPFNVPVNPVAAEPTWVPFKVRTAVAFSTSLTVYCISVEVVPEGVVKLLV